MSYKFQKGDATLDGALAVSTITVDDASGFAGNGLVNNSGSLDISVAAAGGMELSGDALQIKAAGVTNAMLSGAIASSKLAELNSFDTGDLTEGSNLYYTDARWDTKMAAADTGDLAEGSNLYYTDTRVTTRVADAASAAAVRGHFSAGPGIDIASGVVSVDALGVTDAMLAGSISDGKLAQDYIQTSEVDDSSIEFSGSALQVKAAGITNAMLSGAIASSKLAELNSFDTDALSEGSTNLYYTDARWDTKMAAADTGDLSEGSNLYYTDARARSAVSAGDGLDYVSGSGVFSLDLKVSGGLQIDTGELALQVNSNQFAIDAFGLELSSSVAGEGLELQAGALVAKHAVAQRTGAATIAYGVNICPSGSSAFTLTLPTIGSNDIGKTVIVKTANAASHNITVQRGGSDVIDGSLTSVVLESDGAALTLVGAGLGQWAII